MMRSADSNDEAGRRSTGSFTNSSINVKKKDDGNNSRDYVREYIRESTREKSRNWEHDRESTLVSKVHYRSPIRKREYSPENRHNDLRNPYDRRSDSYSKSSRYSHSSDIYKREEYDRRSHHSHDSHRSNRASESAPKTPPHPSFADESYSRDRKTICVSQIAAKAESKDIRRFFEENNCKVNQIRMVMDRHNRRHKGIAYVEFENDIFVRTAISCTGKKLLGIPLVIQLTETEKNRQAQFSAPEVPISTTVSKIPSAEPLLSRIQIDGLHYSIGQDTLERLLRPFGPLDDLKIARDYEGLSRGTAFCKFKNPLDAKEAVSRLQNFSLAGLKLKLQLVKDSHNSSKSHFSLEDDDLHLTAHSRTELMLKWARAKNMIGTKSLHITNLPIINEVNYNLEADLRGELENYGRIKDFKLLSGEGFVYYEDPASVDAAQKALDGRYFAMRKLTANIE